MRAFYFLIVPVLMLSALTGCDTGSHEADMADYVARLQRTLETSAMAHTPSQIIPPPRSTELQLPVAPGKLDALDFLALRGCALQVTVGKRNSNLGRMAAPSQQLLLDLEYLRLAPDCIANLIQRDESSLAQTLQDSFQLKRDQLPIRIFNATLGGPEYRQLWRASRSPRTYPQQTSSVVTSALQQITSLSERWLAGQYAADNQAFEIALGEVAGGDGGELLRALALQQHWLARANSVVEQRTEGGPLCQPGRTSTEAEVLQTVIQKFFIGKIQPWSASLARRHHELIPPISSLETSLASTLPDTYGEWQQQRNRQLEVTMSAPKDHVKALQTLLAPCR
ncbi:MAG: DUF3080 family protein [Halieaceae bacterium]